MKCNGIGIFSCPGFKNLKKIRIKFLTTDNTDNIPTSWLTAHRQLADKIPTRF